MDPVKGDIAEAVACKRRFDSYPQLDAEAVENALQACLARDAEVSAAFVTGAGAAFQIGGAPFWDQLLKKMAALVDVDVPGTDIKDRVQALLGVDDCPAAATVIADAAHKGHAQGSDYDYRPYM